LIHIFLVSMNCKRNLWRLWKHRIAGEWERILYSICSLVSVCCQSKVISCCSLACQDMPSTSTFFSAHTKYRVFNTYLQTHLVLKLIFVSVELFFTKLNSILRLQLYHLHCCGCVDTRVEWWNNAVRERHI
jgi:hypothetical protein